MQILGAFLFLAFLDALARTPRRSPTNGVPGQPRRTGTDPCVSRAPAQPRLMAHLGRPDLRVNEFGELE